MKMKCSEVKVGNRVRKDLGNIGDLANNIKELGLLQPIGITKDNELVFGGRRLAACKSLNYEEIEVVVIDSDDLLECETTENVNRKGFNMSERITIRKVYKDKIIEKNAEMMKKRAESAQDIKPKKKRAESAHFQQDKLAKLSGVGRDTARKEDVVGAFNDQDIIDQVDNGELSVNKAYCLIKKMKKEVKVNDNKVNTLPAEEIVDVVAEQSPIDNSIYTITITDNYGSLELPVEISNAIKYFSEEAKGTPKVIIEATLNRDFKDYM